MAKIKVFGLGGFGEYGKNMYVITVDGKYFILDSGIKYPSNELYGIDEIIPDFTVLKRVKNDICGVFLSNAHEANIGALVHILKEVKLNIYATKLTMEVIKDEFLDNNLNYPNDLMHTITEDSIIDFGVCNVSFLKTTNSIPESLAISINTKDGSIFYTSEFSFDEGANPLYKTNYKKLAELANKGILALLVESYGSKRLVQSGSNIMFSYEIDNIFKDSKSRIIFSLYSDDLLKIQNIIDKAIKYDKKIAILGRKAQRLVDLAISNKYLEIPEKNFKKLLFIDEKNKNMDKDLVVLVTGQRHEPFHMLQRMIKKQDKLIHIEESDTVVILTPILSGIEGISNKTFNYLSRANVNIIEIKKELLETSNATANEIKMMINLTRPKYIIPLIGEFQHQAMAIKIAKELGYCDDNCFLFENGDLLDLTDGLSKVFKGEVPVGEILIDGTPIYDKNDVVMKDRELLAQDGIIIISANISKDNKPYGDIILKTQGFYNPPNHDEFMKDLKQYFKDLFLDMLKKPRRMWNDLKRQIRSKMIMFIDGKTHRNPVFIISINEI